MTVQSRCIMTYILTQITTFNPSQTIRMKRILSIAAFLILIHSHANGEVRMPRIFSDGMVLQRDRVVKIWGWAASGESVSVAFNGQKASARANKSGAWSVTLAAQPAGGPYTLVIKGKSNTINFADVLVGDVWICSGQSNMEWIVRNSNDADREIAAANYPNIRHFTVEKAMSYSPQADLAGGKWQVCRPEAAGDFSAVAYFFGRKLNQDLNVPIGLINTSWGGTNIETWTSWEVMGKIDPYTMVDIEKEKQASAEQARLREQYNAAMNLNKGMKEKWYDPGYSSEGWKKIAVPADWGNTAIGNADGIVWYRKEIELPQGITGPATLSLGPIDDADWTYINGTLVGETNNYSKARLYTLPEGLLKPGKNLLVIKVADYQGGGGPYGKLELIHLTIGESSFPLAGEWQYKAEVLTTDYGVRNTGPNSFPSQLYNAMVSPIINYSIKGAIWYQGESNTYMAYRYRTYFANMITNWRSKWGYDFPFLWVQLANFMSPQPELSQSSWAELREAQSMTLSLPATAQAVIIDIGEANDIHPRNKQDVGLRLALGALKMVYGKPVVHSGPVYNSMRVEGKEIVISFKEVGSGLSVKDKYGYVKGFAIAGADQKFYWAKAVITGNEVRVGSDQVDAPVAVRYAWADNPDDANLYNKEGLPASPFRTDEWPGVTVGK